MTFVLTDFLEFIKLMQSTWGVGASATLSIPRSTGHRYNYGNLMIEIGATVIQQRHYANVPPPIRRICHGYLPVVQRTTQPIPVECVVSGAGPVHARHVSFKSINSPCLVKRDSSKSSRTSLCVSPRVSRNTPGHFGQLNDTLALCQCRSCESAKSVKVTNYCNPIWKLIL